MRLESLPGIYWLGAETPTAVNLGLSVQAIFP